MGGRKFILPSLSLKLLRTVLVQWLFFVAFSLHGFGNDQGDFITVCLKLRKGVSLWCKGARDAKVALWVRNNVC